MLQAEILVQYGMRSKAIERLQRIQELFPREEERNQDLQQLYLAAGMTPHSRGFSAASAASSAAKAAPAAAPSPRARLRRRNPPTSTASPRWRTSPASSTGRPMPMPSCPPRSLKSVRSGRSAAASWPRASRGWCPARSRSTSREGVNAGDPAGFEQAGHRGSGCRHEARAR